MGNVMASMPGV